jgi:hypothetical protein
MGWLAGTVANRATTLTPRRGPAINQLLLVDVAASFSGYDC